MKNILTIILSLALSWPCFSFAQTERKANWELPTEGIIRAFVIFAQIEGDNYGDEHYNSEIWPSGELPVNPDSFIDTELKENSADYESLLSQIFSEISFGKLHIIGDYYPSLIKIPDYEWTAKKDFEKAFNKIEKDTFKTAHNYTYPNDFDNWKMVNGEMVEGHDGELELKLLIIRRAEGQYDRGATSGSILKITSSQMITYASNTALKHEVGHAYFPDNNYHSGGHNAGERYFISELNGYDLMSGGDTFMKSYNAWNRHWIGWFPDNYAYEIQAMNQSGALVNTDLDYMEHKGEVKEFIIRDTPSTGDAVRIKLPYVGQGSEANQYIWLENHQFLESTVNGKYWYKTNFIPKGLYINYQVGNDDLAGRSSVHALGISTLPSFGNYDYFYGDTVIDGVARKVRRTSYEYNNPLTGEMMTERMVMDENKDNSLIVPDPFSFYTKYEVFDPYYTFINGNIIPEEDCVYLTYAHSGGKKQCFYEGDKAGIGYNPALVPKITVQKSNNTIYLNGLSVEFVDQLTDGSIKVRVRFNDYDVVNDVRWCGNIVSKERVILKQGKTITFDRGFSPSRPENPEIFNGMKLFNDPTSFVAEQGSVFTMEAGSNVIVRNGSTLTFKAGSLLTLADGARLVVEQGSRLNIENGAVVRLFGDSQIVIKAGATVDIKNGINLTLVDSESVIKCDEYFINANSGQDIGQIPFSGYGDIVILWHEYNIQNRSISEEESVYGAVIRAGSHVNKNAVIGDVVVEDGGKLIIKYKDGLLLDSGFSTEKGAELIIKKDRDN